MAIGDQSRKYHKNLLSKDCDKNPISIENQGPGDCRLNKDYWEEQNNMSSKENMVDAEKIANWVEQQSAAAAE